MASPMDLFKNVTNASDTMFQDKIIQIFIDGPSVNLKVYSDATKDRNEKGLARLVDIDTTGGLHTKHGATMYGAERSEWKLKSIMKLSFNTLCNSLARRKDYGNSTGLHVYPVPFCTTRWTEDKSVVDKLI